MWPPRGDHTSPPAGSWSDRRRALGLLENTGGWTGYRALFTLPEGGEAGKAAPRGWPSLRRDHTPRAGHWHLRLLAVSPDP